MKKNNNYRKISIIFPTLNGWEDTKACLSSIKKISYHKEMLEVIIVDNHSSDGTPQYIKKLYPEIIFIQLSNNVGYAKAVNTGLKQATGEYIMFGNNDVVYDKRFFIEMVKLAESDKRIGIIGGKAYYIDEPNKIAFGGLRLNPYLGYHPYDLTSLDKIRSCDIVPAGGFFVKKSALKYTGLLDENYFLYFEDVDFFLRMKREGFKVIYNPHAIYYHGFGKTSLRENLDRMIYYGYRSKWRCILKNATILQIIISLLFQCFFLIHIENLRSSIKTYKPFLRGLYWNLIHLQETLKSRS